MNNEFSYAEDTKIKGLKLLKRRMIIRKIALKKIFCYCFASFVSSMVPGSGSGGDTHNYRE